MIFQLKNNCLFKKDLQITRFKKKNVFQFMSYTFTHSQSKALRRSFLPHPSSKSQRFQAVLNFNYIQPYFDSFNLVLALSHV